MPDVHVHTELSILGKDILRTLLYYDIFSYPLTADEVFWNSTLTNINKSRVQKELIEVLDESRDRTAETLPFAAKKQRTNRFFEKWDKIARWFD